MVHQVLLATLDLLVYQDFQAYQDAMEVQDPLDFQECLAHQDCTDHVEAPALLAFQVDKAFPEQQGPEVGQVRPGQLVNQADVRSAKLLDAQVQRVEPALQDRPVFPGGQDILDRQEQQDRMELVVHLLPQRLQEL